MSLRRLVTRSLRYYWRTGIVVVFALAVASAVIVGSLVIGDSVTGSIRRSALSRLGNIHYALTAPEYFREELAAGLEGRAASLILLDGAARNAATDAVLPTVTAIGVDAALWSLYQGATDPGLSGREAAINQSLARDLDLKPGDALLLTVGEDSDVPTDTLFARRERERAARAVRLTVRSVLPDEGAGAFGLSAQPGTPRNVFVERGWLAGQLGRKGQVNAIVVGAPATAPHLSGRDARPTVNDLQLDDHRLKVVESEQGYLSVQSKGILLSEREVEAIRQAAAECGARADVTSVYLADSIKALGAEGAGESDQDEAAQGAERGREIAYAMVGAVGRMSPVQIVEGDVREIGDGLVLNRWAANDLDAKLGERFRITYLVPSWEQAYETTSVELTLTGIIGTPGMGTDPDLVPEFEGITDAEHVDDWDPPFPVDLDRVTDRDEEYWELYRAAPKAFVGLSTARAIWASGPSGIGTGWVTSVRVYPARGETLPDLQPRLEQALLAQLRPEDAGLVFKPVRAMALEASRGSSDFSQLFLGMSLFLVLAGAGLAGMLLRLSVDRRAAQAGIMLATGFTGRAAAHVILAEGAALALPGAALGVPLGVAYAACMVRALGSWWQEALGAGPSLWLFVRPTTLVEGALAGLAVGLVAGWWSARRLVRSEALELLAGWQAPQAAPRGRPRGPQMVVIALAAVVALLMLLLAAVRAVAATTAFFLIGSALLVAGVSATALLLTRAMRRGGAANATALLALRNAAAGRGRSLLVVGLIAAASFVIVAVAANSRDFSHLNVADKRSGTGGFSLLATCSIPLPHDFGTPEGRAALGFAPEDESAFEGVTTLSLRASPGEDISCLNIARPSQPRVLGVSDRMIERGGFRLAAGGEHPWEALRGEPTERGIPAFGDAASIQWQLHSGRGKTYLLQRAGGEPAKLRFVGLLSGSIFQSEILVHESHLRALFPEVDAPSYFLIEAPAERADGVAEALRRNLGDMGLQVRSTAEVLNEYIGVQNTYLSMFLALGGLGLLLGSVGLVAVLLRSALERRGQFALMLATGFRPGDLARMLVLEHAGLLLAGLVLGGVAALVAVAPQLASAVSSVNWGALGSVLVGMMIIGLAACALAARMAVRGSLIEALREE